MLGPAKIYFIIFGLISIAGGVMGYTKAGSTASLIAGGLSGLILVAAGFLLPGQPVAGLALGGFVSLLLAIQFLPKFISAGKMMPAGLMSILSVLGVILAVVAWMRK